MPQITSKKYYTKREVVERFTLSQLKELSKFFEICKFASTKEELVRCIEKEKSISKSLLEILLETKGKTIREKIKNLRGNFYEKFIGKKNEVLDEINEILGEYLGKAMLGNLEIINRLEELLRQLLDMKDEKLPREFERMITPGLVKAFYAVKNEIYCTVKVVKKALESLKNEDNLLDVLEIKRKIKNERIKHYLIEARKCYAVKSYDATVVMIARATEYIIKDFLKRNNISFSDKDTLGILIGKFRNNFTDSASKRVLEKIMEVQNLDRIVGAHDKQQDRKIITHDEADHAWTAIQVILKELMNIEYKPSLD